MATKKTAGRGGKSAATRCDVCGAPAEVCLADYDQTLNSQTGSLDSDGQRALHWFCRDHANEYCELRGHAVRPTGDYAIHSVVPRWQVAPKFEDGIELLVVLNCDVSVYMTGTWKGEGMHIAFCGREGDEEPEVTHLVIAFCAPQAITLPPADDLTPTLWDR